MDFSLILSQCLGVTSRIFGYGLTIWALLTVINCMHVYISVKYGKIIKPSGNKAIIITGATSGFGLALSKLMFKRGFTIFACYYNNQEVGFVELMKLAQKEDDFEENDVKKKSSTVNETSHRPHLFLIPLNVISEESIEKASVEINSLMDKYNLELYCLLNNAAISIDGPFEWVDYSSIRSMIDTNLLGLMVVTRRFMSKIIESKGRVINVSSGMQYISGEKLSLYGSTKRAVTYFSETLHEDIKVYGARCCCVLPGNFSTNTNLVFARMSRLQQTKKNLPKSELNMYIKSIDKYGDIIDNLVRERLHDTKEDLNQIATAYNIDEPLLRSIMSKNKRQHVGYIRRFVAWVYSKVDGGGQGKSVEESGVLDGFEYAICAEEPIAKVHAGHWTYFHIWGPAFEVMPSFITSLLGNQMSRLLHKV